MNTATHGFFITFEGPEGAGKSTQIRLLADYLHQRGRVCTLTREPGGTPLAEKIRAIVKNHSGAEVLRDETELLLMESARSQHVAEVILPALERGEVVLCDRFYDSTSAYQGFARGLDVPWIDRLNRFACGGVAPDLTLLLDLAPERGFERTRSRSETLGEFDRFEVEKLEFHRRVREGFLELARREPERIRIVDADRSAEQVAASIREIADESLF